MQSSKLPVFKYNISNKTDGEQDIHIDGDIVDASTQEIYKNWFGDDTSVSFKSFRNQVENSDAAVFNIYINSGGGQLTEALAMHDFIVELKGKGKTVNTIGRGIIASAATYILMAGTNKATKNSWFMIHNVSGRISGTVDEVEQYAATMRKFNDKARDFYSSYTGIRKEDITKMMNAETWLSADEAKDKGFVKEVTSEATFSNTIKPEQWLFEDKAILNKYNSFTQSNSSTMDMKKITDAITNGFNDLMKNLGLSNKAGDDNVKTALTAFTKSITDSLGENTPSKETLEGLVNTAVTEAFKNLGTNEAFKLAITNATKDNVTTETLKTEFKNFTKDLVKQLGNASGELTNKNKKVAKRTAPKNRFAGIDFANYGGPDEVEIEEEDEE